VDLFKSKKPAAPLRALHIDDSQWVRIPVSVLLRRHFGMKVFEAGSGPEGLLLAERERPDIIILDVMMPHMDGFDTLAKLKENPRTNHIPVLMCTSRDIAREVNLAVRLGAVAYLTKPIEEDILIEKIKHILTVTGKWGNVAPARRNPYAIPPDPHIDMVVPKKDETETALAQPVEPIATAAEKKGRPCASCQTPLKYIEQYDAWYCYPCRKYPDLQS
jgi:twitching motility two-component system response regulator PilH